MTQSTAPSESIDRLAQAWQAFDIPVREGAGIDERLLENLKTALQAFAESWASSDSIPRMAANILVDIYPATESNASLYDETESEKITQAAYELHELVGECVALAGT